MKCHQPQQTKQIHIQKTIRAVKIDMFVFRSIWILDTIAISIDCIEKGGPLTSKVKFFQELESFLNIFRRKLIIYRNLCFYGNLYEIFFFDFKSAEECQNVNADFDPRIRVVRQLIIFEY